MLRQRHGAIQAGYYEPDYAEGAWAPPVGTRNVNHALMSFDLARLPSYPEFSIEFNQWSRESGGGAQFVGEPYAVRLYQSLSWPSISSADLDNLETFFRDVARAQSESWEWYSPEQGIVWPVRFADADFPETAEISPGRHQLSGLRLMIDINYSGLVPSGVPTYTAAMGTAFAVGDVVMQFPAPQRPNTGHGLTTRHALEDSSAGAPVVYRAGKTTRNNWMLSWSNLDFYHCNWLHSFFITYCRGMLRPFTWYDTDGTPRTVRLAENKITIEQTGWSRYSCDLPLIEDI